MTLPFAVTQLGLEARHALSVAMTDSASLAGDDALGCDRTAQQQVRWRKAEGRRQKAKAELEVLLNQGSGDLPCSNLTAAGDRAAKLMSARFKNYPQYRSPITVGRG
ncbi:MAG: hypothetical protein AAGD09_24055 [Cyanobacteria bacterium P01_F01_bin.56]